MRKVILLIHVSLDGFAAAPDGNLEWIAYSEELAAYAYSLQDAADTALFGRVTYRGMESYWPTVPTNPESSKPDIEHALWLNESTKIVFSRTLEQDKLRWENSLLVKDNIAEAIAKQKQQPGKDMLILGGPSIAHKFIRLGLVDDYRINVNPIILGGGISLFAGIDKTIQLKLLETKPFASGGCMMRYAPVR